ncbi:MAG: hypothetical protein C4342_05910, partial [Armatimonadota bacterium]
MRAVLYPMMLLMLFGCAQMEEPRPPSDATAEAVRPIAVMIHGAGGGGWEWKFWQEEFERAGWRVVAPDLMPAKAGVAATTVDDYIEQVVSAARAAGESPVLIGASMGGILALKAAERIEARAIVLVNSVPPVGVESTRPQDKIPDVVEWSKSPLKETEDALWDSSREVIEWAHERWRDESGAVLRQLRSGLETKKPSCPVLVIASDKDNDIPPEVSQKLAKMLSADFVLYHQMSHVGPLLGRRARAVARHTLGWLSD